MRIVKYLSIASTALALTVSAMAKNAQQATDTGQLVAANAELQTSIDAKTAKVGDLVTAKLTAPVRIPGVGELHRNTALVGHIDRVQPAENNGTSTVVLTFDKAQPKRGQLMAIKATIVGVYPNGTEVLPPALDPQYKVEQEPATKHGYSLTSDVMDSNSGVLRAKGKNVRVKHGTELELAMTLTPENSTANGN
ncbi:MAG TPA: hypothetical protein VGM27_09770 [Acidobacteriaceae bacterium]|jgi:hypothetical protein